ncbi:FHA domain-containing protein [Bifidobacterium sp. ESL0732]|uniref:variant leucine-rich repeat-containing protein n=1 Tax=Bifidobacterium sp. ESL0732 TaxID=2983222 RepID=UPI0023F7266F|nr:FHA domain-containing protein [Bifidobacterium sp. ESL0732]WEV64402.1 FHA domain-containing protein [Bifidobacterium sp. ESL0732]
MNMMYMGGRKVSDPRTTKHWVIKVNGSTKVDVGPGENVEIGRRPLRPLADDGHRRLEIDDDTRSMSKRHAVFTVAANGGASVTDLNSTNGSYIVEEKGLRPLTPNQDFIFPDSPMRLQFGDVPVDFVRVDVDESPDNANRITDLFDYAASGGESADVEPDLNDMSVDDILNLRAGEPTTAFSAADVASRIGTASSVGIDGNGNPQGLDERSANDASADAGNSANEAPSSIEEHPSQKPENTQIEHTIDQFSLNVMAPAAQSEDAKARDLFKDAMETESEDKAEADGQAATAAARPAVSSNGTSKPSVNAASDPSITDATPDLVENGSSQPGPQRQQVSLPSRRNAGQNPVETSRAQQSVGSSAAMQPQGSLNVSPSENAGVGVTGYVSVDQSQSRANNASNGLSDSGQASADQDAAVFVPMDENPRQANDVGGARSGLNFTDSQSGESEDEAFKERSKFMPPVRDEASTPSQAPINNAGTFDTAQNFKPSFEPGSVFEKVSNGEFDQPQPQVEVEGMSSQEAKTTADFSLQFEMAKHPELLPFLAMNPSLYGDLYAWLSAVGNNDIDAALSQNSGYIEYRKEVGEGRKQ